MAIEIGTNLSYKGEQYLDQRQEVATLEELSTWSTPVPAGFEVFCREDSSWYVYCPEEDVEGTIIPGHFVLRIDYEVEDSQIQGQVDGNSQDIDHIQDIIFPITFVDVVGGGYYEVGDSEILPLITWTIEKDNLETLPDSVTVNGSSAGVFIRTVESGGSFFRASSPITESTEYVLEATYGELTCNTTVNYTVLPKKYILLSLDPELTELDTSIYCNDEWAKSFDGNYKLDCSGNEVEGGVYVHYLIPRAIWPGADHYFINVGGIAFSSVTERLMTLVNSHGVEIEYVDLVFDNKQNGILDVSFKRCCD